MAGVIHAGVRFLFMTVQVITQVVSDLLLQTRMTFVSAGIDDANRLAVPCRESPTVRVADSQTIDVVVRLAQLRQFIGRISAAVVSLASPRSERGGHHDLAAADLPDLCNVAAATPDFIAFPGERCDDDLQLRFVCRESILTRQRLGRRQRSPVQKSAHRARRIVRDP